MSMPPGQQHQPQQQWGPPPGSLPPGQPPAGYPPPPRRPRNVLPWVLGIVVLVVIGAVVLTLVLVLGSDEESGTATGSDGAEYDLSSPVAAAQSFAAAAKAGDSAAVLKLTCVADEQCVTRLGKAGPAAVEQAKKRITEGVPRLAEQLGGAQFQLARDASGDVGMEVPYTTPEMSQGEFRALMFVESGGKWLYFGSAGGGGGGGSSGGGGASGP